jgi:hypothetical protein
MEEKIAKSKLNHDTNGIFRKCENEEQPKNIITAKALEIYSNPDKVVDSITEKFGKNPISNIQQINLELSNSNNQN